MMNYNRSNSSVSGITGVETMKQLVPQGIESVNGSAVNMGCTSSLVNIGGVMICTSQSYFVDGCSPAFDTNTSDWASQLVTVRKTHTDEIKYSHVLLTFVFDTAVTLIGVEMDLFLCPEWGIGAPTVSVCATKDVNFVFNETGHTVCLYRYPTDLPSIECVSLTHVITNFETSNAYVAWHIIFDPVKEWIHVGEVTFLFDRDGSYAGMICELHNNTHGQDIFMLKVGRHF